MELLPVLPYAMFGAGVIMGWRYSNTGMILASLAMGLSYGCLVSTGSGPGITMGAGASVLLPVNLLLFSLLTKRRLFTSFGLAALGALVFQALTVWVFCEPGLTDLVNTTMQLSPEIGGRFVNIRAKLNALFNNHGPLGMDHLSILGQVVFLLVLYYLRTPSVLYS